MIGHPLNTIKTWQQATNSRIGTSIYEIIVRNNGVGLTMCIVNWNLGLFGKLPPLSLTLSFVTSWAIKSTLLIEELEFFSSMDFTGGWRFLSLLLVPLTPCSLAYMAMNYAICKVIALLTKKSNKNGVDTCKQCQENREEKPHNPEKWK